MQTSGWVWEHGEDIEFLIVAFGRVGGVCGDRFRGSEVIAPFRIEGCEFGVG